MKLIIVGAGASGLCAGIFAARAVERSGKSCDITILEGGSKPGKKLLSTGNGHCNLTNTDEKPNRWHSDMPALAGEVLRRFDSQKTVDFFDSLGIPCISREGYIYPRCREAAAVREALVAECRDLGVKILCDKKADRLEYAPERYETNEEGRKIRTGDAGFTLYCGEEFFTADRVILAAGGMAFPKSGSDGSGYSLAMDMGHNLIQPLPALVALTAEESCTKQLAGVRAEAVVSLYIDNIRRRTEEGEVQLTEYGVSGIPVFQLSGDAVEALCMEKEVEVILNFWDGRSETDVLYVLKQRVKNRPGQESGELLRGIVPDKMIPVLLAASEIPLHIPTGSIHPLALNRLSRQLTAFRFRINGAKNFDSAQVTRGGVPLEEVDSRLQSKKQPGLFLAGELLNVDGQCGGYNLQWAWASGSLAGESAVR